MISKTPHDALEVERMLLDEVGTNRRDSGLNQQVGRNKVDNVSMLQGLPS